MKKKELSKYVDQAKALYDEALEAAKDLLRASEGKYIYTDSQDVFYAYYIGSDVATPLTVAGVGLNETGHICIHAIVDNSLYDCDGWWWLDDGQWADLNEWHVDPCCYPHLYQFVAKNIKLATTKSDADSRIEESECEEDY